MFSERDTSTLLDQCYHAQQYNILFHVCKALLNLSIFKDTQNYDFLFGKFLHLCFNWMGIKIKRIRWVIVVLRCYVFSINSNIVWNKLFCCSWRNCVLFVPGSLYRGRYVRFERAESPCDSRGLWNGCCKSYAERFWEEYVHQEAVEVIDVGDDNKK